jgi:hypothetical protein
MRRHAAKFVTARPSNDALLTFDSVSIRALLTDVQRCLDDADIAGSTTTSSDTNQGIHV